jgi:hypothetical protein
MGTFSVLGTPRPMEITREFTTGSSFSAGIRKQHLDTTV